MLKDLINNNTGRHPFMATAVYFLKKYTVKFPADDVFKVRHPALLLIKAGTFRLHAAAAVQNLQAHDLLIIPRDSDCREIETGENLQFYLIPFSLGSEGHMIQDQKTFSFLYLAGREAVKISLDDSDYRVLSLICRLLYAEGKNRLPSDFDIELGRISCNLLAFELKLIYSRYFSSAALHVSKAEKLAVQFLAVLSIHCRRHHTVAFFAGVLHVTPVYLNRAVKQAAGKTAKKMITEAVLAEAVSLLEDSDYTISEIAEELEFSSPSALDIFFKKWMSCTPSEFRSNASQRFKSR